MRRRQYKKDPRSGFRGAGLLFSDFFVIVELPQNLLNAVTRIKQGADRTVVIQRIDQESDVFAHVAADVVRLQQQFRLLIYKVCGDKLGEPAFFIGLVKFSQSVGEKTEGAARNSLW